ncbi:MAG: division/cell wall cluster transcriptional repressor MraZ [Armatimonadota bacterium]
MGPQGPTVNKLDASGRIALREQHLDELEESVVLTQGFNGNLVMMAPAQWPDMMQEFAAKSPLDPDMNDLRRIFIGGATEVEIDDRGRIKIPEALRSAAGLKPGESRTMLLNMGSTWEIWEEQHYLEYTRTQHQHLKELARMRFGSLAVGPGGTEATSEAGVQ